MTDPDDLFELYRADRAGGTKLQGDALASAFVDSLRRTLAMMEKLTAEVEQALAKAKYSLRLEPSLTDRGSYVRLDRTSDIFRDYLRGWALRREGTGGTIHLEGSIHVGDSRRNSADIGLGIVVEWRGQAGQVEAFIEFWTTGQGVPLSSEDRAFQRGLVGAIIRLEERGLIRSAASAG